MNLQSILDVLHGSKPFVLRMVSGRTIEVPHPDFVAINPAHAFLVLTRTESPTFEVIRINQIESVEVVSGGAAA